jgi:hypothetical protein
MVSEKHVHVQTDCAGVQVEPEDVPVLPFLIAGGVFTDELLDICIRRHTAEEAPGRGKQLIAVVCHVDEIRPDAIFSGRELKNLLGTCADPESRAKLYEPRQHLRRPETQESETSVLVARS